VKFSLMKNRGTTARIPEITPTAHPMKHLLPTTSAATAAVFLAACSETPVVAPPSEPIALFNGENFEGWSHVLVEDLPLEAVWSVEDGVIICKGEPFGYLKTADSFQDFVLTFEWKWPGEPGNSGVLFRIASEPETFMPKCVEAQLKHGSAGDLWAFFGASIDGDEDRARSVEDHEALGNFTGISMSQNAEKPAGEWNHYEIRVEGDSVALRVNGELVNEAHGLDVVSGPIGLQSEGAEIHFRNLEILSL
jgi:hypothetical protein